jgi:hypothetical protein
MPPSINKFAPQIIVLAIALYWSWPALKTFVPGPASSVPQVEAKKPGSSQDFARAALSPTFAPLASRNPFLASDTKLANAGGRFQRGGTGGTAKTAADIRDAGLVLSATCIAGGQRMAIINGKVYKEKEAIQRPGEEAGSCIVLDILPHKVLLSYQGETLQLSYVNGTKRAAGGDPRKPAK